MLLKNVSKATLLKNPAKILQILRKPAKTLLKIVSKATLLKNPAKILQVLRQPAKTLLKNVSKATAKILQRSYCMAKHNCYLQCNAFLITVTNLCMFVLEREC